MLPITTDYTVMSAFSGDEASCPNAQDWVAIEVFQLERTVFVADTPSQDFQQGNVESPSETVSCVLLHDKGYSC